MDGNTCSDEMMWMIGWCLDGVGSDQAPAFGPDLESAEYVGSFESINVAGASATRAFGINARGDIVGSYTDAMGTHGFLSRGGVFATIDVPNAPGHATTSTEAWGINPRGDIIGRYTAAGVAGTRGFLLSHGTYSDISATSHLITLPTKIGASGEIVGCFHDVSSIQDMYGYVQRGANGTTFTLPSITFPSGSAAMHNGITPGAKIVVGLTFPTATTARGYVVNGGIVTMIDFPGSNNTQLWDVNPTGISVGQYFGRLGHYNFGRPDSSLGPEVPHLCLTECRGERPPTVHRSSSRDGHLGRPPSRLSSRNGRVRGPFAIFAEDHCYGQVDHVHSSSSSSRGTAASPARNQRRGAIAARS